MCFTSILYQRKIQLSIRLSLPCRMMKPGILWKSTDVRTFVRLETRYEGFFSNFNFFLAKPENSYYDASTKF